MLLTREKLSVIIREAVKKNLSESGLNPTILDMLQDVDATNVVNAVELLYSLLEEEISRPPGSINIRKVLQLSFPVLKIFNRHTAQIDYLMQKIAGIQVNIDMGERNRIRMHNFYDENPDEVPGGAQNLQPGSYPLDRHFDDQINRLKGKQDLIKTEITKLKNINNILKSYLDLSSSYHNYILPQ